MGEEEIKIARHSYLLIRIRMALFGELFSVSKECVFEIMKISVFVATSWIIFVSHICRDS